MKKVLAGLLMFVMCFTLVGCGKEQTQSNNNGTNNVEQNEQKNSGTVERETIDTTIAKLNTEIVDNGMEYPASEDYLVVQDGVYWYGIYQGISFYIVPENFTGDKSKDITKVSGFVVEKNDAINDWGVSYAKHLIKANNNEYTKEDVEDLFIKAKNGMNTDEVFNNGHGIWFFISEDDDSFEYQVERIYE